MKILSFRNTCKKLNTFFMRQKDDHTVQFDGLEHSILMFHVIAIQEWKHQLKKRLTIDDFKNLLNK